MTLKKAKNGRRPPWPGVYERVHKSGNVSYVVDLGQINGRRDRTSFRTKYEANAFAEQKRTEKANHGASALAISQEIKMDAVKAHAILSPHSVTLHEAAQYYLNHVIAYRNSPPISEIVERMLVESERNDRRDRTVQDLKWRLNVFAEQFSGRRLSDLTVEEIEGWIYEDDEWSGRSRINFLTKVSQIFNYAIKHGWVESNLAERIDRPSVEDSDPEIFKVEQAEQLLRNAGDHGLLPYISLGLFAGLRSAELMRLDGQDVKFEDRAVIVGSEVAKKRSRRVVEMCDALFAWLGPIQPLKGPIVNKQEFRENMLGLKASAGIESWPQNGLRHSFGSYHLALYGDGGKTAQQMGHRSTDIVHNHYKTLVLKTEAEKFWALRPAAPSDSTQQ